VLSETKCDFSIIVANFLVTMGLPSDLESYHQCFFQACEDGLESLVELLLSLKNLVECGVDGKINPNQFNGECPMDYPESNPLCDPHGGFWPRAIDHAAVFGRLGVVKILVKHGALVNISGFTPKTEFNWKSPLMYAAGGGHMDIVKFLVEEAKADVQEVDCSGLSGLPALYWALYYGQVAVAEYLVKLPHRPRLMQLMTASALVLERADMIEFLVEHGADLDYDISKDPETAHMDSLIPYVKASSLSATAKSHKEIAEAVARGLEKRGKGVELQLHRNEATTGLLTGKMSQVKQMNEDLGFYYQYFFQACEDGHEPLVELLLSPENLVTRGVERGKINVNQSNIHCALEYPEPNSLRDPDGKFPPRAIDHAAAFGRLGVVKMLVKHGALVNISGFTPETEFSWKSPLMYAAGGGHMDIVKFLVEEAKADVQEVDRSPRSGLPALYWALYYGQVAVAEYLAKVHYSPRVMQLMTASALVVERADMIEFLVEHGADLGYDISKDLRMDTLNLSNMCFPLCAFSTLLTNSSVRTPAPVPAEDTCAGMIHFIPSVKFLVIVTIQSLVHDLLIPLLLLPFNWNSPKCSPPLDDLSVGW